MTDKELMAEAAILYYEKKMTQQEIAELLYLSRQTVSKLLSEALENNIVEITVHHPKKDCAELAEAIKRRFGVKEVKVCSSGSRNDSVRLMHTVKCAAEYLMPVFAEGGLNIALSWGRTVRALIPELDELDTEGNLVYPLFGATDSENSSFASNELARSMADRIGAGVKYAWFPYLPDSAADSELFKKTSYYKNMCKLWQSIDIAVVGIGNTEIVDLFKRTFGHSEENAEAVGDIATHFFTSDGRVLELYKNTLCASTDDLKTARTTVAIVSGSDKTSAVSGALKTHIIDVLITDEYTASELLL